MRLETFLRGGVRHTTREAIERFFAAITAAADGNATPVRTSRLTAGGNRSSGGR